MFTILINLPHKLMIRPGVLLRTVVVLFCWPTVWWDETNVTGDSFQPFRARVSNGCTQPRTPRNVAQLKTLNLLRDLAQLADCWIG